MRISLIGFFVLALLCLLAVLLYPYVIPLFFLKAAGIVFCLYASGLLILLLYKKQYAMVNKLKKELQQAHIAFLRNMTHELRTPLNGVIGMSDLLYETSLNHEQLDYLETIRTSSDTLLSIVNDILDLSRLSSGKFDLALSSARLYQIIDAVYEQFYQAARDKNLQLLVDFDNTVPAGAYVDEARLIQVLHGLVRNGIKFTNSGYVKIKTALKSKNGSDAGILFSVEDSGIGMDEKTLKMVFNRFTQADSNDTRKFGGTGIGLTLCKEVLSLMKSELFVESRKGKGSLFHFTIHCKADDSGHTTDSGTGKAGVAIISENDNTYPLEICRHAGYMAESFSDITEIKAGDDRFSVYVFQINEFSDTFSVLPLLRTSDENRNVIFCLDNMNTEFIEGDNKDFYLRKPVTGRKLLKALELVMRETEQTLRLSDDKINILIAEDDNVNQYIFRRMLERINCSVQLAQNGREALELFVSNQFDLVIMDSRMPVMSGPEALREIKKMNTRKIPVIALTGMASPDDISYFKSIGFDDFIAKPVKLNELSDAIFKWVKRKNPLHSYTEFDSQEFMLHWNKGYESIKRKISFFIFIADQFFHYSENSAALEKYVLPFQIQAKDIYAGALSAALEEYIKSGKKESGYILKKIRLLYEKLRMELNFLLDSF
ncbi:MAG: response regulator [Spirochaetales bacterium]|nr:response regulator [Spirochaetales bacterium]